MRLKNIMKSAGYEDDIENFLKIPRSSMFQLKGFGLKTLSEIDQIEQHRKGQATPVRAKPDTSPLVQHRSEDLLQRVSFQEFLRSLVSFSPAKYSRVLIDSVHNNAQLKIPHDIRDVKLGKILCFTRNVDLPLAKPLTRVINRFSTFRDLENLSVNDFLNTEGIGSIAAKAFFVWYAKLQLLNYEEFLSDLLPKTQNPPLISTYLKTQFNELGIADLWQLSSSPDRDIPPLAALELRTLEYFESQDTIASAANLLDNEDFLQCVYRYTKQELNEREGDVVELRYSNGDITQSTLQNIGLKLGLTRERVRQILANVHKTFKEKYILSSEHYRKQIVLMLLVSKAPLKASDISPNIIDINEANIAMSFIADIFPEVPIDGHLQAPDTKALSKYSSRLKTCMDDGESLNWHSYIDENNDSTTEVLLKIYAVFVSPKYALALENDELKIINSDLSLMEAVLVCVSNFNRPSTIDEIADALDQLETYSDPASHSFETQKNKRGIGATSLFIALQRNMNLVRIERYQWGLPQHVVYQDQWDGVADATATIIGDSVVENSSLHL